MTKLTLIAVLSFLFLPAEAEVSPLLRYLTELVQNAASDASTLVLIDMKSDEIIHLSISSMPVMLIGREPSARGEGIRRRFNKL